MIQSKPKATKANFEIHFIFSESQFTHFKIFDKIYEIPKNSIIIDIDDNKFKFGKDFIVTQMDIISEEKEKIIRTHSFHLYYGENIAYCYLNIIGSTYELIFKEPDISHFSQFKISSNNIDLNKFDNFGNEERKRLILINYKDDIPLFINGNKFFLPDFKPKIITSNSFQLSFYNIKEKIVSATEITLLNNIIVDIEKYINDNKNILSNFYQEIKAFSKEEITSIDKHKKKLNEIINKNVNILDFEIKFINYPNNYLEKILNNDEYVKVFYIKNIYSLLNNKKNKILKNRDYFLKSISLFEEYNEKFLEDKSLTNYQRILVINNFFEIFRNSKGIEGFKNQKFKYYNLSKSNKNSIFSLTLNFLNSFINKLTTKSKLFFPILQINSDIGYYKGEQVYTFNIMNIEMIKTHLREIVPNILFFYGRNSKTEAYTKVDDGSIIINTKNTFIRDNIDDFQKELKDKNLLEGKNKAIYLFRLLLHEMMGHKKYLYKNSQKPLSPIKVINKEGKLISLVHINKNEDNENCWKIFGDPQEAKGDSGHYLEAYLGQIDGEFVIHMFDKAKNLGKLIDNVELFVDENLEKLKQYIHLKYQLTSCNYRIDCSDMNIDEEINTIENDKKIKNIFLSKKTKRNQKKEEEKIIKKKKLKENHKK